MNVRFQAAPEQGLAALSVSQRASIAARMMSGARPRRKDWMQAARASFAPSEREACAACGKYQSVSQAHHIYPLAQQYEDGRDQPCHDHVWLCPTHHMVVHEIIDGLIRNVCPSLDGVPPYERDTCDGFAALFVDARQRA